MLQPARVRDDGRTGLTLSDFFDFSVYVDAATSDIRQWYVERFLRLRETAFRDPASYFARYAALSHDEAIAEAEHIWDSINGPNLAQNILPTRGRADPGAAQGPRPLGPLRAAAQDLSPSPPGRGARSASDEPRNQGTEWSRRLEAVTAPHLTHRSASVPRGVLDSRCPSPC